MKEYLCDVGHSSSPRHPFEFIPDNIQQGLIGHFRIVNNFFLTFNRRDMDLMILVIYFLN